MPRHRATRRSLSIPQSTRGNRRPSEPAVARTATSTPKGAPGRDRLPDQVRLRQWCSAPSLCRRARRQHGSSEFRSRFQFAMSTSASASLRISLTGAPSHRILLSQLAFTTVTVTLFGVSAVHGSISDRLEAVTPGARPVSVCNFMTPPSRSWKTTMTIQMNLNGVPYTGTILSHASIPGSGYNTFSHHSLTAYWLQSSFYTTTLSGWRTHSGQDAHSSEVT